ncbi:hypothetical protein LTR84_006369 [Exophiala bonariae]|uniref:Programmed cell death protein 5 n=1 Tax=Exophiala bonariae TaxID=1690606 RepID=A0AAV9N3S9_9EURO|nr:hypothetical protein LTR84_006369 [Exophiala bonariae]
MADDELAQIRAARLAQLKQQGGGRGGGPTGDGGHDDDQKKQESEARSSILHQILEPEAQDRLGRIRLVKESRATDVENRLITLARSGQLRSKVTEDQLKDMLASLSEHEKQSGQTLESVKVVRRGGWDDDDDLDDLLKDS